MPLDYFTEVSFITALNNSSTVSNKIMLTFVVASATLSKPAVLENIKFKPDITQKLEQTRSVWLFHLEQATGSELFYGKAFKRTYDHVSCCRMTLNCSGLKFVWLVNICNRCSLSFAEAGIMSEDCSKRYYVRTVGGGFSHGTLTELVGNYLHTSVDAGTDLMFTLYFMLFI